jgi:hypothetical protein
MKVVQSLGVMKPNSLNGVRPFLNIRRALPIVYNVAFSTQSRTSVENMYLSLMAFHNSFFFSLGTQHQCSNVTQTFYLTKVPQSLHHFALIPLGSVGFPYLSIAVTTKIPACSLFLFLWSLFHTFIDFDDVTMSNDDSTSSCFSVSNNSRRVIQRGCFAG